MTNRTRISAVVFTVVMVISLGAGGTGTGIVGASGHTGPPPAGQVFEATNNVDAWERGAFPLRADLANARWTIQNANWNLQDKDGNQNALNKDMAVFAKGTSITFEFKSDRANTGVFDGSGRTVQVIRAYLDPDVDVTKAKTFSGALDLLTPQNANDNATFKKLPDENFDSGGDFDFTDTPSQSGHYVYFVATKESGKNGFTVSGGDLSVNGNVTVIGAEHIAVETGGAKVSPGANTVQRGKTVSFTVSQPGVPSGTSVTHVLALYHEPKYQGGIFTIEAETEITKTFDIENDATLNHDIVEVNGVAQLDDDITVLGVDLDDGKVSKSVGIDAVVDFIAEKANFAKPKTDPTPPDVLDASIRGFEDTATSGRKISVQSFNNWSTTGGSNNYRWVYLALSDDSTVLATDTGRITIQKTAPTTPSPPSGGGGGGGAPPSLVSPPTGPPRITGAQPTRTEQAGFRDDDPEQPGVNIRFTQGIVDEITFAGEDEPGGQIEVQELDRAPTPEEVSDGEQVESVVRAIRVNVPAGQSSRGASIRFRLSQAEIGDRDPGNVRLALLTDQGWQLLETTPVDPTADPVQFTARTPHFSDFAVVFVRPRAATATPAPATATPVPTPAAATATPGATTAPPEAIATETQPAPTSPPEAAPPEEPAGMDPVTIVLVVVVLAVLVAAGYVLYRRRELE